MKENNVVPRGNERSNDGEGSVPPKVPTKDVAISRRAFARSVAKIAALGALSNFTLLAGEANAAGDACPGGADEDDNCAPPTDPDNCPGEALPQDNCFPDGLKPEDRCDIGDHAADICNDAEDATSDQCATGASSDDVCLDSNIGDKCPTLRLPEDECPPKGTTAQGDICPGGDAAVDTCEPEGSGSAGGDDCTPGDFCEILSPKDDCKTGSPDECTYTNDDVCTNGTNTGSGSGNDDWCDPNPIPISTGSDQCIDGTPAQDTCNGKSDKVGDGLWDHCPGGGVTVDTCDPATAKSDDYCFEGMPDSDECVADADECPGGGPTVDECPGGEPPADECTAGGGCSGGDEPPAGAFNTDECSAEADCCGTEESCSTEDDCGTEDSCSGGDYVE